jgi:hypothetical protein
MNQKLYRIKFVTHRIGDVYVVGTDPTEAYNKVRKDLDLRDVHFTKDREMDSIELLAESIHLAPPCGHMLFL